MNKHKGNFKKVAKAVAAGAGDVLQGKSIAYGMGTALKKIANHPDWYTNLQVVSTNLNFNQQRGTTGKDFYQHPIGVSVSVILNRPFLDLVPTAVDSNSGTIASDKISSEAFDTATSLLYSTIRSVNAGNINYSLEVFRRYILNALSFHAAYNHFARSIRILQSVDVYDRLTPEPMHKLFSAPDVPEYANDLAELAQSRDTLNLLSKQLCAIYPLPPMDMLEKIKFMFSNVFGDVKSVKESYYGYRLGGITLWDDDGTASINYIPDNLYRSIGLFGDLLYAETESRALIAGDILKAFGTQIVDAYQFIDARDVIKVVVDAYAKEQFCNTVVHIQATSGPKVLKLPNNLGYTYYTPFVQSERDVNDIHDVIINAPFDDVPMGQSLSLTSNTSPYILTKSASNLVVALPTHSDGMSFGPARVVMFDNDSGLGALTIPSIWYQYGVLNDTGVLINFIAALSYAKMLGVFPQLIGLAGTTFDGASALPVSDISNFALYTYSQARSFSTQRVLSLYNVNTRYEKRASLAIL